MPPPPRAGLERTIAGVNPECERYFLAYKAAHLGAEPTQEELVHGVRRYGVSRDRVYRDWRRLTGRVHAVRSGGVYGP